MIDAKETLSLIFHLKQIRKGNVNEDRQIKELIELMEYYEIRPNDLQIDSIDFEDNELSQQRVNINNKIDTCRKMLK